MKNEEVERMRELLVEAITTLCRSGLKFKNSMRVEGLLGVTLDEEDIILVNVNKSYNIGKPAEKKESEVMDNDARTERVGQAESEESFDDSNVKPTRRMREEINITIQEEVDEKHSIKREPPDDLDAGVKRVKSHHYGTNIEETLPYSSRVPPFHPNNPETLNNMSWSQHNIPSSSGNVNQKTNNSGTNDSFLQETQEDFLNTDSSLQGTEKNSQSKGSGSNVKIEILSSESESEETGIYQKQTPFGGQDGALYGVPVDSQGAEMFDPVTGFPGIPGAGQTGAGDFSFGDSAMPHNSSTMGFPSRSGKAQEVGISK